MINLKTSKKFTSEKRANSFAKMVGGIVLDLRKHPERKSDFKVVYERKKRNNGFGFDFDFDSAINGYGTNWHTAEDF